MYKLITKNLESPYYSSWHGATLLRSATYAVLPSGKEIFLLNKVTGVVEPERMNNSTIVRNIKKDEEECIELARQLEKNGGKWLDRYASDPDQPNEVRGKNPAEFVRWVKSKGYTFDQEMTEIICCEDGTAVFHGNLNEFSCAFNFIIVDEGLMRELMNESRVEIVA